MVKLLDDQPVLLVVKPLVLWIGQPLGMDHDGDY